MGRWVWFGALRAKLAILTFVTSPGPGLGFQVWSSAGQLLVWEFRIFLIFELEAGFGLRGRNQDRDMGGLVRNQGGLKIVQIQQLEKKKRKVTSIIA